jgi:hypothetical protein
MRPRRRRLGVQRRVGRSIEGHIAGAGSGSSWARPAAADPLAREVSVGLSGDVTLEDADDLGSRPSFANTSGPMGMPVLAASALTHATHAAVCLPQGGDTK